MKHTTNTHETILETFIATCNGISKPITVRLHFRHMTGENACYYPPTLRGWSGDIEMFACIDRATWRDCRTGDVYKAADSGQRIA